MKSDYLKFVQWSEADELYVGYCPDLFIGGVCHGVNEQKVYGELTALVSAEVAAARQARRRLPARSAQVTMPVAV